MKKTILAIAAIFMLNQADAQLTIQNDGVGADVSGTILVKYVDASTVFPLETHLIVTNESGADASWRITRVKQSVPATWTDQICWPPSCFPTSGDVYITPNTSGNPAPIVLNASNMTTDGYLAEIKPTITPDLAFSSTSLYMYYVTDLSGNYVDSVGIEVNFSLGIEDVAPLVQVDVSPNPANELLTISVQGVIDASVQIFDVLGNEVYNGLVTESKLINVSSFNNGVYFLNVQSEGINPINKKIVVKH